MDKIIQTIVSHKQDMNIVDFQSRQFEYDWEDLIKVIKQENKNTHPINSTMDGPILPPGKCKIYGLVLSSEKIHLTIEKDSFVESVLFYKI